MEPNNPEEPVNPEEQMDLSRAMNSDESSDSDESTDSSRSFFSDESSDEEEEKCITIFDLPSRRKLAKQIRLEICSETELSPTYVESKITQLKTFRENFQVSYLSINGYITEMLPFVMALWLFNTVILKEEYYRELVNTVMFLAEAIGSQIVIEVVVGNLIDIDNFFVSGGRAKVVKRQCHKMAMETIAKMMSMSDFDPTDVCPNVDTILTDVIGRHKERIIRDPVMLDSIVTIENKLDISI
ncbi:uncharacterized protein LOC103573550 isoform X2 [Microplitis demolitor]|nr:uncharacterized protein LOC103573550 isoform X2 [Microplitis demolitor]